MVTHMSYIWLYILVGGWPTPWKMMEFVRLDHHPNYWGKTCSKPPARDLGPLATTQPAHASTVEDEIPGGPISMAEKKSVQKMCQEISKNWEDLIGSIYHLVMTNSLPWKDPPFLIGKPSINRPFSMAMLNNQRVNGRIPPKSPAHRILQLSN